MEEKEFHPLGNRIVVKRNEPRKQTSGGIHLPETIDEQPMEGIVVAIGPGSWENGERTTFHVREGDRVLFGKWSGDAFEADGNEYLVMTEENLIGILR